MQRALDITAILVTHDQEEAMMMSDIIAIMNGGRIVQLGTPTQLYEDPVDRFVAEFLGGVNLFPVHATEAAGGGDLVADIRRPPAFRAAPPAGAPRQENGSASVRSAYKSAPPTRPRRISRHGSCGGPIWAASGSTSCGATSASTSSPKWRSTAMTPSSMRALRSVSRGRRAAHGYCRRPCPHPAGLFFDRLPLCFGALLILAVTAQTVD